MGGGAFAAPGRMNPGPSKPRSNQPTGYVPRGGGVQRPRYVYGRRHEYIYYPVGWIDAATGTSYEKGYYDENGTRYEDVAFQKDGKYENVVCSCPYCGQSTVMDLSAQDVGSKQLQCPSCGGPMEIKSELDEYIRSGGADGTEDRGVRQTGRRRSGLKWYIIVLAVLVVLGLMENTSKPAPEPEPAPIQQLNADPNFVNYNDYDTLSLVRTGENSFRIAAAGEAADKTMDWQIEDKYSLTNPWNGFIL